MDALEKGSFVVLGLEQEGDTFVKCTQVVCTAQQFLMSLSSTGALSNNSPRAWEPNRGNISRVCKY